MSLFSVRETPIACMPPPALSFSATSSPGKCLFASLSAPVLRVHKGIIALGVTSHWVTLPLELPVHR